MGDNRSRLCSHRVIAPPCLLHYRHNNFDLLRLVAATQVVFIHSFGYTELYESWPAWPSLCWLSASPAISRAILSAPPPSPPGSPGRRPSCNPSTRSICATSDSGCSTAPCGRSKRGERGLPSGSPQASLHRRPEDPPPVSRAPQPPHGLYLDDPPLASVAGRAGVGVHEPPWIQADNPTPSGRSKTRIPPARRGAGRGPSSPLLLRS